MTDPTTVLSVLNYVKSALDLAKTIREMDVSLASAELKGKLADMTSTLADVKVSLVEIQETLTEKDKRIKDLEEAFELRGDLARQGDAYYFKNAEGKPAGVAHCLRCWINDHKIRPLVQSGGRGNQINFCTACGTEYFSGQTFKLPD